MAHFKSFILGVGTALCVYYITRKDKNGISILDHILDSPSAVLNTAKDYAIEEAVHTLKQKVDY